MRRANFAAILVSVALGGAGCVTVAEHRKLEDEVAGMRQSSRRSAQHATADLRAELRALRERLSVIEGRIEANEHATQQALKEAQQARREAARAPAPRAGGPSPDAPARAGSPTGSAEGAQGSAGAPAVESRGATAPRPPSGEVGAYRAARNAWRDGAWQACIDRFRGFLQTYPSSSYADDAAFWLADCHFKQGDYKTAILRFDDVVARYPDGERSADALYRQGESLLRLGPGYSKAASRAFERVLREYPESPRAPEAKRQLDLLKPN